MELTSAETDLLTAYLEPFTTLAGDARTRRLIDATIRGIIGAESLCVTRIAAFSPATSHQPLR